MCYIVIKNKKPISKETFGVDSKILIGINFFRVRIINRFTFLKSIKLKHGTPVLNEQK